MANQKIIYHHFSDQVCTAKKMKWGLLRWRIFLFIHLPQSKQTTHLTQSLIVQASSPPPLHPPHHHHHPSSSPYKASLWPAPTPRQATGGMLRLVFSQSSLGRGLRQAEIWSGPCLNTRFTVGVFCVPHWQRKHLKFWGKSPPLSGFAVHIFKFSFCFFVRALHSSPYDDLLR